MLRSKWMGNVQELITKANEHNVPLTIDLIKEIVETDDKKRFSFNEDQGQYKDIQLK